MPSPLKPRIVFPQAMAALKRSPALGILGARQVGKSTLARQLAKAAKRKVLFLDLESPADLDRLREPEAFLWRHRDRLIVIDEVQRMPEDSSRCCAH